MADAEATLRNRALAEQEEIDRRDPDLCTVLDRVCQAMGDDASEADANLRVPRQLRSAEREVPLEQRELRVTVHARTDQAVAALKRILAAGLEATKEDDR